MTIRILRGTGQGGLEEELGKASRVFMTRASGGLFHPMNYGTHLAYEHGSPDMNFVFEDLQVPAGQRGLDNEALKLKSRLAVAELAEENARKEVRDRDAIIATMVNMLGGSVTINPAELANVNRFELTAFHMKNPDYLTLTVEEKK